MKDFFNVQLILTISKNKGNLKFCIHYHQIHPMTFLEKLFLLEKGKIYVKVIIEIKKNNCFTAKL